MVKEVDEDNYHHCQDWHAGLESSCHMGQWHPTEERLCESRLLCLRAVSCWQRKWLGPCDHVVSGMEFGALGFTLSVVAIWGQRQTLKRAITVSIFIIYSSLNNFARVHD